MPSTWSSVSSSPPPSSYAPTNNTASHDNHEKINSWVSLCFPKMGCLWGSAIIDWCLVINTAQLTNDRIRYPISVHRFGVLLRFCRLTEAVGKTEHRIIHYITFLLIYSLCGFLKNSGRAIFFVFWRTPAKFWTNHNNKPIWKRWRSFTIKKTNHQWLQRGNML